MTEFVIHTIPGSPYARAVLLALEEKQTPYRVVPVAPGQHRAPAHLIRHPLGRVPVVEHGDFTLYETQAILRYIDRVIPDPPLAPTEPRALARMDQLMNINDWYLFQGCGNVIVFQRLIGPRLLGRAPDESAIAAAMPNAHRVFEELARLLGDQPYFVGETATLADLLIAPQLDLFSRIPEWDILTAGLEGLVAWLARMNARSSMSATTWERVSEMTRAA